MIGIARNYCTVGDPRQKLPLESQDDLAWLAPAVLRTYESRLARPNCNWTIPLILTQEYIASASPSY